MLRVVQGLGEHVCSLIEHSDMLNVNLTIVHTFMDEMIPTIDVLLLLCFSGFVEERQHLDCPRKP